jgi:anti-repressor protein
MVEKFGKEQRDMKDLTIINRNGQKALDSREVADMIGKEHAHLLRDIRNYVAILDPNPKLDSAKFFLESNYRDAQNQERPCFLCTKLGCDMVANKLTGEKGVLFTAAYVTKFNEMEQPQFYIPKTMHEALQLAADYAKQIELQAPKVEYAEALLASDGDLDIKETADALAVPGMGRNNLFKFLKDKNVLVDSYHVYREHIDAGRFRQVPRPYTNLKTGQREISTQIMVTPKGVDYIRKLLNRGM